MRTQDEIITRIGERREHDFLGFEIDEYILCLDFAHAGPYLKDGATEENWAGATDVLPPVERMQAYMEFAWGKANDERGISANRSVLHYIAWLWLTEEDEPLAKVEHMYDTDYHYYGKPILEIVCDHFGWDWTQWDNGVRANV